LTIAPAASSALPIPPPIPPTPTNRRVGVANRRLAVGVDATRNERRIGKADRRVAAPLAAAPAEGPPVNPAHVFVNGILHATSVGGLRTSADDPAVKQFIADSLAARDKAKAALKTALDAFLSGAAVDIVKLEADAIPAAEALIENRTSPVTGNAIKALVGMASPIAMPLLYSVNAKLFAGIADFRDHLGV
jgi:hypothetical protein